MFQGNGRLAGVDDNVEGSDQTIWHERYPLRVSS